MPTVIRHQRAPFVGGCRWCGFIKAEHEQSGQLVCIGLLRAHEYTPPTPEQRKARLDVRIQAMTGPAGLGMTVGELSDLSRGIQRDEQGRPVYRVSGR